MLSSEIIDKDGFSISVPLVGTAGATAGNYGIFFIADRACEVKKIKLRYNTASSSGTVNVERLRGTEALDAGDEILTTDASTSATANTTYEYDYTNFNLDSRILKENEALALKDGGTLTNLVGLCVTVYLTPLGKGSYK